MKSKSVVYNNIQFRSVLEARWAVFFDQLNIQYQYEPQVIPITIGPYGLVEITYIPDFFLSALDLAVEIKPVRPGEEEIVKATGYMYMASEWGIDEGYPSAIAIFYGNINTNIFLFDWKDKHVVYRNHFRWSQCSECQTIGLWQFGCLPQLCSDNCFGFLFDEMIESVDTATGNILNASRKAKNFVFSDIHTSTQNIQWLRKREQIMQEQYATDKQIAYLRHLNIDIEKGALSKLEASELIGVLTDAEY